MYEPDLALNNLQLLVCHKTKSNDAEINMQFSNLLILPMKDL